MEKGKQIQMWRSFVPSFARNKGRKGQIVVVVSEQRDELIWKIPGKAAGKASNGAEAQKPAQTYARS